MKYLFVVLVSFCLLLSCFGGNVVYADRMETGEPVVTEKVDLFTFDFEPEVSLLYQPADGVVDYGLGFTVVNFYKEIFYAGAVYVPGENLSTEKGEGRSALYGPKIGANILKVAKELKVPILIPIERLRLGTAWLGNFEGGLKMEKYPRIELSYLW